ncbi:hypothetical protein GF351_03005 [Candidatus Woesearchaeota archaeon]|nr:hypothetical protein [Candidatus Woesearchaeota archaeon]
MKALKKLLKIIYQLQALVKKDYKVLLQKKKYLYLSLALPVVLSLIFIFTTTPSTAGVMIGVCDYDNTAETSQMISSISEFEVDKISSEGCAEELIRGIADERYLFGIVIPEGFTEDVKNYKQGQVTAYSDNTDVTLTNYLQWKIELVLKQYEYMMLSETEQDVKAKAEGLGDAITVSRKLVGSLGYSSDITAMIEDELDDAQESVELIEGINARFLTDPVRVALSGIHPDLNPRSIGMTALFPIIALFMLLMLVSTNIIFDKNNGFFARLAASGCTNLMYLLSKLVFFLLVLVVQFGVVFGIFMIAGAGFSISWSALAKAVLVIGAIDISVGILIGILTENEGVALLVSLLLTLPLLFLSGLFYPLRLMPKAMQYISHIFPLNSQILVMRNAMLFAKDVHTELFWTAIILLAAAYYFLRKRV